MALLTTEQFDDALRKGLGRAILALRERCDDDMAQALLGHCLRWRGTDYFVEGGRASYLREAIALSEREPWFVERIADAIRNVASHEGRADVDHLFSLGRELAGDGRGAVAEAMFARASTLDFNTDYDATLTLLSLDAPRALPILVASMGRAARKGAWSSFTDLVRDCRERDAHTRGLLGIVRAASMTDPDARAYRVACVRQRRSRGAGDASDAPSGNPFWTTPATLDSLEQAFAITEEPDIPWLCKRWARAADDEELRRVAIVLGHSADHARTSRLLCVFLHDAPFPLALTSLAPLLDSSDEVVAYRAAAVVSKSNDPGARELALGLLDRGRNARGALRILSRHARPGDATRLLDALGRYADPDVETAMNLDLRDTAERDAANSDTPRLLRWAYERTLCPHCRRSFVEQLVLSNEAPREMLEECAYDSDEDTRAIARGAPR